MHTKMLMGLLMIFALGLFWSLPGIECRHGSLISLDIRAGDMGVDLVHGGGIGPAADLHGDALRHL